MPPGKPIINAFKELNDNQLQQLSPTAQQALLELARWCSRNSGNETTIVLTRVDKVDESSGGLCIDQERLTIIVLAIKPGARMFTGNLYTRYDSNPSRSHLHGLLGVAWPLHSPLHFLLSSVPVEDRALVEEVAEQAQMRLTNQIPVDFVTERKTLKRRPVEYPAHTLKHVVYLVNEPGSAVYTQAGSGDDLFRIESLLLSELSEPSETVQMLNIKDMPEWKGADDALVVQKLAMSIRHASTEYVARENEDVQWGRIEDLTGNSWAISTEVVAFLQQLAERVREESSGAEDIRAMGIESYPGDWENCPHGLHVHKAEHHQLKGDELECPKCKNLLDFEGSKNGRSHMEGQTEHFCVSCGETFWVDENRKITSFTQQASGPGVVFVDDFSAQDIPRRIEDYRFRKLVEDIGEEVD